MQKADTCRHFTGIGFDTCKAGVNYRELAGEPAFGMALRLPCLTRWHDRDGFDPSKVVPCALCDFPSQEEANAAMAQARAESEAHMQRFQSDADEHHLYVCTRCEGEPRFENGDRFVLHLSEVHGMERPIKVGTKMVLHLDATDWYQTDRALYLPNTETLIGYDSHRHPRRGSDRALWSGGEKKPRKRKR